MTTHFFTSPVTLNRLFLTQFGLSIKAPNAIGQFGTGLKYAIAVILRGGGKITITTNYTIYTFTPKTCTIRGQDFQTITATERCPNLDSTDFDLPFTIDLGKNWEPWMAFRELICNSWDEGGVYSATPPYNHSLKTVITVQWDEFDKIDFTKYFCRNTDHLTTLVSDTDITVATSPNPSQRGCIYYKGTLISQVENSPFTYLTNSDRCRGYLTEDRTLQYDSLVYNWATQAFSTLPEAEPLIQWWEGLLANHSSEIRHLKTPPDHMMPDFLQAYKSGRLFGERVESIINVYEQSQPPKPLTPTSLQLKTIQQAQAICARGGLSIHKYETVVVEHYNHALLGQAYNGKIHITLEAFKLGLRAVLKTLLEEYCHLEYHCDDGTYQMQHALHEMWISTFCELTDEII